MNDIDDELRFHVEMLERELLEAGLTRSEAHDEALRRFGNWEQIKGELMSGQRAKLRVATKVLLVFAIAVSMQRILLLIPAYAGLYARYPFYVPELIKSACEVLFCVLALVLILRERNVFRALGLQRNRFTDAVLFAAVVTAPMSIGFFLTRGTRIDDAFALVYLAIISPFAEELISRGFAFRQLLMRSGWSVWRSVAVCAFVTGAIHVEKGNTALDILGIFAITALGGAFFSWLVMRWNSLWFAVTTHALMNFWWSYFNVAPTALGGWFAFAMQITSVLLAIIVTRRLTRNANSSRPVEAPAHDVPTAMQRAMI